MFGPGNAQLPVPPMLMFDRIVKITEDGGMAWVHRRLTSGESTVMRVKPTRLALHKKPRAEAEITAYMNPRSIAELPKTCEDGWCRVRSEGVSGWAPASELWGTSDAIQCKVGRPGVARSR